jgi:hypothetical protein
MAFFVETDPIVAALLDHEASPQYYSTNYVASEFQVL